MKCGLAVTPGSIAGALRSSGIDYNATVIPRSDWTRVEVAARTLDDCVRRLVHR